MRKWSCPLQTKSALRKSLRARRAEVSNEQREQAALAAMELLTQQDFFKTHQHIACYLSHKHEFNTQPIIEAIWREGKQCYLPVLAAEPQNGLVFFNYKKNDRLHYNEYDILEPDATTASALPKEELDIVLVPLIGFDLQGHRLGTGGGYYDRTFSFLLNTHSQKKPFLIGVGYSFQEIENINADSWDVPLDGLLSEKACFFPLIAK